MFLLSLSDVGRPKPLFAVNKNSEGSSVLAEAAGVSAERACLTGRKAGPGVRGPRLAGTASYSGKSSGPTVGGRGGTGGPSGGREIGGNGVADGGGGTFTGGKAAGTSGPGLGWGTASVSLAAFWNSKGSY